MAPWRHFSGNLQRHFSSGPRTTRKNDAGGFQKNDARVPEKGTTIQLVQLKLSLRMAPWRHFSGNLQRHFSSGPRTTRKNDAGGFQKNDARVPPYTTPL